jgi:hypothetical protein
MKTGDPNVSFVRRRSKISLASGGTGLVNAITTRTESRMAAMIVPICKGSLVLVTCHVSTAFSHSYPRKWEVKRHCDKSRDSKCVYPGSKKVKTGLERDFERIANRERRSRRSQGVNKA